MPHQYAFDAAKLLIQCQDELSSSSEINLSSHIRGLQEVLSKTEQELHAYFQGYLVEEQLDADEEVKALLQTISPTKLAYSVRLSKSIKRHKKSVAKQHKHQQQHLHSAPTFYEYPQRTTTDSLLFRLVTILQLCLVRIDDALWVLAGRRRVVPGPSVDHQPHRYTLATKALAATSLAGVLAVWTYTAGNRTNRRPISDASVSNDWLMLLAKVGITGVVVACLRSRGNKAWMTSKIVDSTTSLGDWNRQWQAIQPSMEPPSYGKHAMDLNDTDQARLLMEFALKEPRKTSIWRTSGELRFFVLKRAMNIFYASVEAAMEVTNASSASDWQLLGATAAAASFYSTPGTGASRRVAAITSSSQASADLIRKAWGMVSLPAVKNLSLQASRYLKGAAVADRVVIGGVPCFVLSKDPAPELATTIEYYKRFRGKTTASSLATIDEGELHTPTSTCSNTPFARSSSLSRCRQRDVIFHLTGGGFFAHIIASDLPYLLDWSAATGAVVICPEYCLLPEHCFPDALKEVTNVYQHLVSGDAVTQLGFEVNRIVVTGESAGGNLATALCISLSQRAIELEQATMDLSNETSGILSEVPLPMPVRFPDAIMLSCPVLNLSSDLNPSRAGRSQDPVMPGSIISAISNAYIPLRLEVSRKDPLVSPIFACDEFLRRFPPTLMFASSNDPVMDDAVVLNGRLRDLGVESELQVADNLPHAYLGLGTTGFPEAVQVQNQCQSWLRFQLTRHELLENDSSSSWEC